MKEVDDVYTVEKLIDKKKKRGQVFYLVKWKNWSDSDNTWEPESNILDKNLITEFERTYNRKNAKHDSSLEKSLLDSSFQSTETDEGISMPISPLRLSEEAVNTANEVINQQQQPSGGSSTIAQMSVCSTTSPSSMSQGVLPSQQNQHGPINQVEHSMTEMMDWHYESRFRKTTLIVAAASHSAAMQSNKLGKHSHQQQSPTFNQSIAPPKEPLTLESCTKSLPALSPRSPIPASMGPISDTTVQDGREKIRLVIPRDRLKACPPPGVPSSSSASHNSSLAQNITPETSFDNNVEPFASPIEVARRLSNEMTPPMPELFADANLDILPMEKMDVDEISLHKKSTKDSSDRKRRRKLLKSHRHKKHESRKKRRKRSSSTASCVSTASSSSEANIQPPRLAPLRIQLPKLSQDKKKDVRHDSWMAKFAAQPPSDFYSPSIERLKMVQNVSVTDITIGDLTISIKESSNPKDFFGVSSSQEVILPRPEPLNKQVPETETSGIVNNLTPKKEIEPFLNSSDKENECLAAIGNSPVIEKQPSSEVTLSTISEENSFNRSDDTFIDVCTTPKPPIEPPVMPKFLSSTPTAGSPSRNSDIDNMEPRPKSADQSKRISNDLFRDRLQKSVPSMVPLRRASNLVKLSTPHLGPMRKIVSTTKLSHRPSSLIKLSQNSNAKRGRPSKNANKKLVQPPKLDRSNDKLSSVYAFPDESPTADDLLPVSSSMSVASTSTPTCTVPVMNSTSTPQDCNTMAYLQYFNWMSKMNGSTVAPTVPGEKYQVVGHIPQGAPMSAFPFLPTALSTINGQTNTADEMPIDLSSKR